MKKIEKLTLEQLAAIPAFVEKWTKIGLSTEPADRPKAERAIKLMYEAGGKKPPAKIVWCGSPLSQGLVRAIILDKKADSVSVGASVRASVMDSVGASVRASVGDSVWDSVGDSVRDSLGASVYGQHDVSWLAFYRYFHDNVSLVDQTSKLGGLWMLAESAGWAIPHENICWVSERHCVLERNEQGRLHCVSGPAVAYPDGWSIYAVNGVRVPELVVMRPYEITVAMIEAEANAEVRRVMIDRFEGGPAAYLNASGAKVIDHDERFGTLRVKKVADDEPIVMVEVINRTAEPDGHYKHYMLRVPPTIRTAHEAIAWTFSKTPAEYMPEFES